MTKCHVPPHDRADIKFHRELQDDTVSLACYAGVAAIALALVGVVVWLVYKGVTG